MKILSIENLDINKILHYFEKDVVVIPTETVYGLAAAINNENALKNIYKLKRRPSDNPLIVHVSSIEMLKTVIEGEIPKVYEKIIENFWPGPISLLFKANKNVSRTVTAGLDTILVRMPDNKVILEIIEKLNIPLAAPSANLSGKPSPSCVQHTIDDFGEECPLYLDGGECRVGLESTVFTYLDSPAILRPGGICIEVLEKLIGEKININYSVKKIGNQQICPGQKYKHYSPNNKFVLIISDSVNIEELVKEYKKVGILTHYDFKPKIKREQDCETIYLGNKPYEVAMNLFKGLRKLDETCDIIITKGVSIEMEGEAIMDRVKKAAHMII
ncbi:threonylcarbamoyl-amp synthase SUA5 [Vairimorpha necatrix]|uniref:Threonylcarbamoyl-AMP synthase n=1 Tax=Vairimorpha necatrix TaxID=6039 RepID=A0AAX4JAI8_9MICR